jgi:excisionase family DNA binding protein
MDTQQLPALPERLAFSLIEVAVVTTLSLSTINRRVASGEIKSLKVGRRRLVPKAELEKLCSIDHGATS